MAEIRVERKRGISVWVWVLLALLIIVAVVWYLAQTGTINIPGITNTTAQSGGVSEWLRTASESVAIRLA
jgi:adenosylcobinamide amidohydrolase